MSIWGTEGYLLDGLVHKQPLYYDNKDEQN